MYSDLHHLRQLSTSQCPDGLVCPQYPLPKKDHHYPMQELEEISFLTNIPLV